MKNAAKKFLTGTAVIAAVGAVAALLYRRYNDDLYEYIPEEAEFPEDAESTVAADEAMPTDDDFVTAVDESEPSDEEPETPAEE